MQSKCPGAFALTIISPALGEIEHHTLSHTTILKEYWRKEYNQLRPRSVLNYRQPAPESIVLIELTQKVV